MTFTYSYEFEILEPFAGYHVEANTPGPGFYCFVFIYTVLVFVLIIPLVSWSKRKHLQQQQKDVEDNQQQQVENRIENNKQHQGTVDYKNHLVPSAAKDEEDGEKISQMDLKESAVPNTPKMSSSRSARSSASKTNNNRTTNSGTDESLIMEQQQSQRHQQRTSSVTSGNTVGSKRSSVSALRNVLIRELDQSYPDQDPEFLWVRNQRRSSSTPQIATKKAQNHMDYSSTTKKKSVSPQQQQQQPDQNQQPQYNTGDSSQTRRTETSSGVISAATTSKVFYQQNATASNKRFSHRLLDVSGRRWKNRRPIGRVDVIQNVIASSDASSLGGSAFMSANKTKDIKRRNSSSTNNSMIRPQPQRVTSIQRHPPRQRGMSDVASSILSEQHHQLHQQPDVQVDLSLMKKQEQLERQYQIQQLMRLQQQYQNQNQHQNPFVMHRLAALQRQQYQQRCQNQYKSRSQRGSKSSRRGSWSMASEPSMMSSIVDDISPNDAADVNDPGRGNIFIDPDMKYLEKAQRESYQTHIGLNIHAGCCSGPLEGLLALAAPDENKWHVFVSSIPLTFGASSESLFRLITVAFISQYLGAESMVAFLLVGLFVRLTSEELAGAIIDALSSFLQASIYSPPLPDNSGHNQPTSAAVSTSSANTFLAGQYVQLAVILQLVLNIPLLFIWAVFMETVVMWLVNSSTIAAIAQDYVHIVVFAYLIQTLSRTLTCVFHICGHEHFESIIEMIAATIQLVTIACVVALVDDTSLVTVGYTQLLITIASAIAKILYPVMRGWMQPFRKGLIQNVALFQNKRGIWYLVKAAGPLLLGTILEYGEWELLTIFVRYSGTAEVATWALLGAFWDVLEAFTEGIGEAAANQVASLLSMGQPERAKRVSHGAIYIAFIQSVLITSALYMSGQYLAVLFTNDPTIQNTMNNTIAMLGVANVTMSFAQITWSLVGAQGRFRLATCVVFLSRWFITMPCALLSIYVFFLDLNAVSGSLVVGYATASCILTVVVLTSDWDRLARMMTEMNQRSVDPSSEEKVDENPVLGLVDLEDFDDSSDDSDGIGFGGCGDDV